MDILEFVKLGEIDPFYFDASCYVALGEAGAHAFPLLLNAMRESGFAEIEVAAEGGKRTQTCSTLPRQSFPSITTSPETIRTT